MVVFRVKRTADLPGFSTVAPPNLHAWMSPDVPTISSSPRPGRPRGCPCSATRRGPDRSPYSHHVSPQAAGGRTGVRILACPLRVKKPGRCVGLPGVSAETEHKRRIHPRSCTQRTQRIAAHLHFAESRDITRWNEQERHPGTDDLRRRIGQICEMFSEKQCAVSAAVKVGEQQAPARPASIPPGFPPTTPTPSSRRRCVTGPASFIRPSSASVGAVAMVGWPANGSSRLGSEIACAKNPHARRTARRQSPRDWSRRRWPASRRRSGPGHREARRTDCPPAGYR